MTFFADLQPLDYFGAGSARVCVAVGWLDREAPYAQGPTPPEVFARLEQLLREPFQPLVPAGVHPCNLCQFQPERSGSANLFIPAEGFLFVAPELIAHYINAHHYAPPGAFAAAVLACPDTGSPEYRRRFLHNGGRELLQYRPGSI